MAAKATKYCITFDIGGTMIKYGIITDNGSLLKSGKIPTNNSRGPENLFQRLTNCVKKNKAIFGENLLGIGLGLTGGVDPQKGVVLLPGKFKDLEGFPIVEKLKREFNVPVYAENDGKLAAYAEKYFGAAKDKNWAVVLTIGTGVGSGVVLDGRILSDPNLLFGVQIGHLIIDKSDDRTCLTGNKGTGEIFCSSKALGLQVQNAIQRGIPSILSDFYPGELHKIDFQKVTEACRKGDTLCLRELDVWTRNLATLIINAAHAYAPEVVILGGGAMMAADLFIDKINRMVNETAFRYPADRTIPIVVSSMKDFGGIMGGAAFLFEKLDIKIKV